MKGPLLCLAFLLIPVISVSQTSDEKNSAAAPEKQSTAPATSAEPPADSSNFTSAKGFVLEDSVPVKLRINRTISSADCHVGDTLTSKFSKTSA
jgi:hypothetical protein